MNKKVFIIAGEASGDILGAGLMRSIKSQHSDVSFAGIGGPQMEKEGLNSLFPMQELSVMGLFEILPKVFHILSLMNMTVSEILKQKPDVVVTIDSPDFCFRAIKRIKAVSRDIPCVHYVAPSVWAWRPGRAKKVARFLDHLLALLPFEPPYFTQHGLATTFVGHPVVEKLTRRGNGERFRQKHGLTSDQPVLCMLPGSRMSEVSRLLPKFSATADIVLRNRHNAVIVVPTLPHLKDYIEKFFVGRGINPILVYGEEDKFDAFAASLAAIAASGTVTLELALHDTPHIIAYKLSPLSAWIAKNFIKTPYVNLINIILGKRVVPELLLENCEPGPMSRALLELMDNKDARAAQIISFREALVQVGLGDPETPSMKAAKVISGILQKGPNAP